MGHNPIRKPKTTESSPYKLCSGTTISLLTLSISRICSHQQIDDYRKERKTTPQNIHQTKG